MFNWGINKNKIKIINLGAIIKFFINIPTTVKPKKKIIISYKLVIGSFVKDSPGFGNSLNAFIKY